MDALKNNKQTESDLTLICEAISHHIKKLRNIGKEGDISFLKNELLVDLYEIKAKLCIKLRKSKTQSEPNYDENCNFGVISVQSFNTAIRICEIVGHVQKISELEHEMKEIHDI